MRSLPDISTHDQQWESNTTPSDLVQRPIQLATCSQPTSTLFSRNSTKKSKFSFPPINSTILYTKSRNSRLLSRLSWYLLLLRMSFLAERSKVKVKVKVTDSRSFYISPHRHTCNWHKWHLRYVKVT